MTTTTNYISLTLSLV